MNRIVGAASDPVTLADRVARVLGPGSVRVDGGTTVASPKSEAETAAILRVAAEHGWRVHPAGAGLGPDAAGGADLILSSLDMTGVIDHAPGDLTVRARSGSTLALLQSALSDAGQWLPLDPPGGPGVTLGGVVSSGTQGPLSAEFGRPRDQLLGLTLVDGRARVLALGGKVVKNVAGFDLVRLTSGSRGALGVVTEVTLRLHPLPELDRVLTWAFTQPSEAWSVGRKLVALPVPVAAAEVIGGDWPLPLPSGGVARTLVRLRGSERAVGQVAKEMIEMAGPPEGDFCEEAAGAIFTALSVAEGEPGPRFRAHALPSAGVEMLEAIHELEPARWAAHLLGGTFRGIFTGDTLPRLGRVVRKVRAAGGRIRTWGTPEAADADLAEPRVVSLTSAILAEFDPSGILPGVWRR